MCIIMHDNEQAGRCGRYVSEGTVIHYQHRANSTARHVLPPFLGIILGWRRNAPARNDRVSVLLNVGR